MKNLFKILGLVLLVTLQFSFTTADTDKLDCSLLHSGTFTYTDDEGDEVVVIIEGDNYKEYHKDRKYTLERKLHWVNDCEFNASFIRSSIPNIEKSHTAVLNLKVDSIDGNYVYYTASLKSVYKGVFKKQGESGSSSK